MLSFDCLKDSYFDYIAVSPPLLDAVIGAESSGLNPLPQVHGDTRIGPISLDRPLTRDRPMIRDRPLTRDIILFSSLLIYRYRLPSVE